MMNFIKRVYHALKGVKKYKIRALLRHIKHSGLSGALTAYRTAEMPIPDGMTEYDLWILNNEPDEKELEKQSGYKSCLNLDFRIIAENDEKLLKSIDSQTYKNFSVEIYGKNRLSDIIGGDYTVFCGKETVLSPFALYETVLSAESRDRIIFFSDSDKLLNGKRTLPNFKPDFSKDTFISQNLFGDFIAVKTDFLRIHPEILENTGEKFIYDIALRTSEKTDLIGHIKKVLFHETFEAPTNNEQSEKEIIKNHLLRRNIAFDSIENGFFAGQYKINYTLSDKPKISVIIPNMDHTDDLDKLLKSIQKSTYKNIETVIVENNSTEKKTFDYYEKIKKDGIKVEPFKTDCFNYSALVNFGVENSTGEYIVLLNNDIEIISDGWAERMLGFVQREDVGICGCKLFFPDRSIQHAGVTLGTRGLAGHRNREVKEQDFTAFDYINITQNLTAVTAAFFMVKRTVFDEALGFDEKLAVAFNDVDFCMKVNRLGKLIVYDPFTEAYHYESKSRGNDEQSEEKQMRFAKEFELFVKRWEKELCEGDPYYNKNLLLNTDLRKINYNKL